MPTMASITVKKYDGTTDVIYDAAASSAGDKSPAVWRNATVGTAPAHRPELRMTTRSNGPNSARRADIAFSYPSLVVGTDGRTTIDARMNLTASAVVPQGMDSDDINEAVYQCCNLLAATLIKQAIRDGFAPT